jgi:maleylpyruvate isomerase
VREVVALIADDIHPVGNLRILNRITASVPDDAGKTAAKAEWSKEVIEVGFKALEVLLSRVAGKFAVGDDVTLADVFIVPQVANAHRWKVDMAPFPTIARVAAAASELPEFKAAAPAAQPDAEPLA